MSGGSVTNRQLEQALDVAERCRKAAERAAVDADRVRWSSAAERLELALRSRGHPGGAQPRPFFDEALERIIEETHALAP